MQKANVEGSKRNAISMDLAFSYLCFVHPVQLLMCQKIAKLFSRINYRLNSAKYLVEEKSEKRRQQHFCIFSAFVPWRMVLNTTSSFH